MACSSELPNELLYRPTGLVVLTGLDLIYNAVHKAIWDSFCNNRRTDRVPLQFKPLAGDHEYIKCRPKRTSYEWYIPKGILKTSWMRKHLDQIPAVVVVFFDLDWDDLLWKERQMECATRVEIVRNSLLGRGTKVCMVLIQKNAPLPPGEDVVAGERAASLCAACELSAKLLFVLPLTDHLLGYTIRLENAFYELAQGYYHNEARKVKSHRDFLNKTTHQFLFVRHQFKIAFYNELKQDTHTALKHYRQAYGHILELRMLDTSLLETKTIAGFISYKICRLSFQHNTPLDAITHFRKLIDFFKGKFGMQDLAFEHSAWMARHFQLFGDLFDEAIKLGLTAIQTQHPGIYYQQAAYQSISRKQLCLGLCHAPPTTAGPQIDVLENLLKLDYYGQRPWRQGQLSIEPPDGLKEKEGIQSLQMLELKVDHSWIIIPMLGTAVAQFKKYKSPRMKRYLMVQMGEEYYHASDYKKALQLLSRVTCDYRQERWWTLLTSVLSTQLRCAYLVGSIQEYVTICLELIGNYTQIAVEDKTRVQTNLVRVISGDVPDPEPGCGDQAVETARVLWTSLSLRTEPVVVTVEMCHIVPFVECKAQFTRETYMADETIHVDVYIRSCCPFLIGFSKLSVQFSNQTYNKHCIVTDDTSVLPGEVRGGGGGGGGGADLCLTPNKVKVHRFSFLPVAEDVHKGLEITSVVLELSGCPTRLAVLHWVGAGGDAVVAPSTGQKSPFRHRVSSTAVGTPKKGEEEEEKVEVQWDQVDVNSFTRILSRPPCADITVKHNAPGLLNERYKFTVAVGNNEPVDIRNVQLLFGLRNNDDGLVIHQATSVSMSVNPSTDGSAATGETTGLRMLTKDLGVIQSLQQISSEFYTLSTVTGELHVLVSVSYDIQVTTSTGQLILCRCYKEELVVLSIISPLDVNIKLVSLMFEPLESVNADQSFLLMADINCSSPCPISFISTSLQLSSDVRFTDEVVESQLSKVSLNCGDSAGECISLIVAMTATNHATVHLGRYVISFTRVDASPDTPPIMSYIPLPSVTVEHVPVYVEVDIPACGSVQCSLPVTYHVYNKTPYMQDIEVLMDSSEAFMFAGYRQVRFHVLPHGEHQLKYNLVPLIPGNVHLPTMHLNMSRYPGTMAALVQKMLPTTIFVQPRNRANSIIQPGQ